MAQTIGILGGTFDPIHNGHLTIAEAAKQQLRLDRLLFIPNALSPLKSDGPHASFEQRVAMLRLALANHPEFEVSDIEGRRGGMSYTIDTLNELQRIYPDARFCLIVGADALREFHRWKNHERIRELAHLAYFDRERIDPRENAELAKRLDLTPMDVSSTMIRDRVRRGLPIDSLVPGAVADYITSSHLYMT